MPEKAEPEHETQGHLCLYFLHMSGGYISLKSHPHRISHHRLPSQKTSPGLLASGESAKSTYVNTCAFSYDEKYRSLNLFFPP